MALIFLSRVYEKYFRWMIWLNILSLYSPELQNSLYKTTTHTDVLIQKYKSMIDKGQVILKGFLVSSISSKKRTKTRRILNSKNEFIRSFSGRIHCLTICYFVKTNVYETKDAFSKSS